MIPVLYRFDFTAGWAQALLYVLAVGVVGYIAWSGWRGAHGPVNPKTQEFDPPSREDRIKRAAIFGLIGVALAIVGLHYALPATIELPFAGRSKGEGIPIHTYGILLASGFILAVTLSGELARREWRGEEGVRKRDQVMDLAFWVLIGGIVGSRVLFIIVNWETYAKNPGSMFDLGGGLVFYGGLIGASIAAFVYSRRHQIDFLRLADIALPTVSLGQCLGRLGCFSAGCCWGDIASQGMKFGVHFPGAQLAKNVFGQVGGTPALAFQSQQTDARWVIEQTGRVIHEQAQGAVQISSWVAQHGTTLPVHPTQLYESMGQFVLFVSLLFLRRYRRFRGQITGMWLMCYAVLRSTVELFRGDVERGTLHGLLTSIGGLPLADKVPLEAWYNISTSQFISICMFTGGAIILYRGGKQVFFPARMTAAAASA
jgi:phosphatidylglycerol:prolipoprotein diacylglycerol transferase